MASRTQGSAGDGSAGAPRRPTTVTAACVAASLTVLLLTAPPPPAAVTVLAGAGSSSDPTAPLVAAVALAAWAVSGWLALMVGLLLLARLPGLLGDVGRVLAARVAPAAVRRAVEAALGLTVAVGALTPSTAVAAALPGPASPPAGGGVELAWDLDWPSSTAASPRVDRPAATRPPAPSPPVGHPAADPPGAPAPAVSRPAASSPVAAPSAVRPPRTRPGPASPPAAPTVTAPHAAAVPPPTSPATTPPPVPSVARPSPAAGPAVVVVRPGDSLWSLAEAWLRRSGTEPTDRQVAQAWPRWWAANREVVGDDPDLLLPGTVLRPPSPGSGSP